MKKQTNISVLKELVNNNVMERVELRTRGAQAFNIADGEEYNVIIAYAKQGGRYYFIDRDGRRFLASHYDRAEWLAGEMLEVIANDRAAAQNAADQLECSGSVLVCADLLALFFEECDSRTTYRNRKQIKAHGARWNKAAQQWQASEPEAVARLREWFGVNSTPTAEKADTANESEPQTDAPTAPTAQGEHTHTTTSDDTDPTEADNTHATETDSKTAQTGANATLCEAGEITDTAPTDTAENFADVLAADRLELLRSAAADFDRLTQDGEHIAAVNARLSALFACGVDVSDLVQDADYKADQRARQRAAVVLTADEFRTLYGCGPDEQPEDCGKVWQFERGTKDTITYELHEIRELGGVYSIILDLCELYPEGHAFPINFNTYSEAAEYLARFRSGVRLVAQPAA